MAGARVYVYAAHAIAHARTKMAGKMATLGKRVPMLELVFSMDMVFSRGVGRCDGSRESVRRPCVCVRVRSSEVSKV